MIRDLIKRTQNPVIRNTMWILSSNIFQMAASLIIGLLTARYLGPSNYGVLSYVGSIVAIFVPLSSVGLQGVVINSLVKEPNNEGVILGSSFLLQFISSILSMFLLLLLIVLLNPRFEFVIIISLLQGLSLMFRSFEIIDYWFQSQLKSKQSAIAKIFTTLIISMYRLYIIYFGKNIIWFGITVLLECLLYGLVVLFLYIRKKGPKLKIQINRMVSLFSQSYHFILSGVMVLVYTQIDKIMLGNYFNETLVGVYSASVHITEMWIFFPTALIVSMRPIIIKYKNSNLQHKYLSSLFSLYSFVFWSSIFVSIFVSVFSNYIVNLLYGSQYVSGETSLKFLIWANAVAMLGNARGVWILAENKNRFVKIYLGWGLLTNILLNSILIPRYGMEGAAFATLITQIVSVYIAPLFYSETRIHTVLLMKSMNPNHLIDAIRGNNG